jgi:hypothetical protein
MLGRVRETQFDHCLLQEQNRAVRQYKGMERMGIVERMLRKAATSLSLQPRSAACCPGPGWSAAASKGVSRHWE